MESPSSKDLDGLSSHDLNTYLTLVKAIARQIHHKLPHSVDYDDLYQNGVLGLMEAHKNYDTSKGVPFLPYARFRIRGAILDGLRKVDNLSRNDRKRVKQDERIPAPILVSTSAPRCYSKSRDACVEDILAANPDHSPYRLFQSEEAHRLLQSAMNDMPARHRKIVFLLFNEGMKAREVAEHFHVNESRVSQIRNSALRRIAVQLEGSGLKFRDFLEAC